MVIPSEAAFTSDYQNFKRVIVATRRKLKEDITKDELCDARDQLEQAAKRALGSYEKLCLESTTVLRTYQRRADTIIPAMNDVVAIITTAVADANEMDLEIPAEQDTTTFMVPTPSTETVPSIFEMPSSRSSNPPVSIPPSAEKTPKLSVLLTPTRKTISSIFETALPKVDEPLASNSPPPKIHPGTCPKIYPKIYPETPAKICPRINPKMNPMIVQNMYTLALSRLRPPERKTEQGTQPITCYPESIPTEPMVGDRPQNHEPLPLEQPVLQTIYTMALSRLRPPEEIP